MNVNKVTKGFYVKNARLIKDIKNMGQNVINVKIKLQLLY